VGSTKLYTVHKSIIPVKFVECFSTFMDYHIHTPNHQQKVPTIPAHSYPHQKSTQQGISHKDANASS
jgi:hypothetical protein